MLCDSERGTLHIPPCRVIGHSASMVGGTHCDQGLSLCFYLVINNSKEVLAVAVKPLIGFYRIFSLSSVNLLLDSQRIFSLFNSVLKLLLLLPFVLSCPSQSVKQ